MRSTPHRFRLYRAVGCLALLLAAGLQVVSARAGDGPSPDGLVEEGRYLDAVANLRSLAGAEEEGPAKARLLARSGHLLACFLDLYDEALSDYRKALSLGPGPDVEATIRFNVAMIDYELDRFAEALGAFEAYIEAFPGDERAGTASFLVGDCRERMRSTKPRLRARSPGMPNQGRVRVLVDSGVRQATVSMGSCNEEGPADREISVAWAPEGLVVDGSRMSEKEFILSGEEAACTRIDAERSFRGDLELRHRPSGIEFVNILDVEDYLRGVVAKEMVSTWPLEALKAQAVAARTFALHRADKRADEPYDVEAGVRSQVYGGFGAETPDTDHAVAETRGEVLLYEGRFALANFHANSGGATAGAGDVWGVEVPYLKGRSDPYSLEAPNSDWTCSLGRSDLARLIGAPGGAGPGSIGLAVEARDPSGRAMSGLVSTKDRRKRIGSNQFRLDMGPGRVRSTNFSVHKRGGAYHIAGKGFGHGVGMSQWGARRMAAEGFGCREILGFYYAGTTVERIE